MDVLRLNSNSLFTLVESIDMPIITWHEGIVGSYKEITCGLIIDHHFDKFLIYGHNRFLWIRKEQLQNYVEKS